MCVFSNEDLTIGTENFLSEEAVKMICAAVSENFALTELDLSVSRMYPFYLSDIKRGLRYITCNMHYSGRYFNT